MRSYEFYQNALEAVCHMDNKPISVAANVKDDMAIANEIHIRAEHGLDISGIGPLGFGYYCIPRAKRRLGLIVSLPEAPQRSLRYDLHTSALSRSQNGSKPGARQA
jgi:hypothetical protein